MAAAAAIPHVFGHPVSVRYQDVTHQKPVAILNTFTRVVYMWNLLSCRSLQSYRFFHRLISSWDQIY